MTPKRKAYHVEPESEDSVNPFGDPHTIPTGWDVAAFCSTERNSSSVYTTPQNLSNLTMPTHYDSAENAIS
jgi:hypothetical protein